ncbi:hypothetical protein [Actinacidiphila soli]|uniref:hypothetical protein n=1 Tax=Actinacidiphila soli TaxID=2487275 RepID=UPI000FCCA965|nr:hypothetical protein [Actinacidiphila soli]
MSKISFEELDGLTGEMLPERSVLSTLAAPFHGWGGGEGGAASDQNGIVSNACQSQNITGTPGLTTLLFGSNVPSSSLTCMPGSTAVF